jgi:hypothetical protein
VETELLALLTHIRGKAPWSEYTFLEAAKDRLSPLEWVLLCYRASPVVVAYHSRQSNRGKHYYPEQIPVSLKDDWEKLTRYTFEPSYCGRIVDNFPAEGSNPHINDPKEKIFSLLTLKAIRKDFDTSRSLETTHIDRVHLDQYLEILYVILFVRRGKRASLT